jgi:hypothetical protein
LSHYLMHTGVYIPTCLFCYVWSNVLILRFL